MAEHFCVSKQYLCLGLSIYLAVLRFSPSNADMQLFELEHVIPRLISSR